MKVAIVGGSKSSEHLAPFDDPDWEIWVHGNQMDRHLDRRVTRIFEIHNDLSEHDEGYAEWLVGFEIPMTVGEEFPVKASHVQGFHFQVSLRQFGRYMLTSTPAYMMSQALFSGADEIAIYGVDMAVDDNEYFHQQPVMAAWIGLAMGKGVKVTIPDESALLKANHIEGVDVKADPGLFSEAEFLSLAQSHTDKITQLQTAITAHDGSRQAYERMAKVARAVESGQQINHLTDTAVIR